MFYVGLWAYRISIVWAIIIDYHFVAHLIHPGCQSFPLLSFQREVMYSSCCTFCLDLFLISVESFLVNCYCWLYTKLELVTKRGEESQVNKRLRWRVNKESRKRKEKFGILIPCRDGWAEKYDVNSEFIHHPRLTRNH